MEKSGGAFFFSWPEAFQAGVEVAGGKGWNLGRLERYGFKVPAGGVLSADAYQDFIEENNLREATEDISQSVTIGNIGEKGIEEKLFLIREKIKAGRILPHIQEELTSGLENTGILEIPVAVRSSATAEDASGASFAGIHESFLNVRGLDNTLSAIKECYASLWTPRAVAYRRKMNVKDDEVIPAVVIMKMVAAEAAGVAFTCDPRTGREDYVVISSNFGLGESIVSGAVEPDEYRFSYWHGIMERIIGSKKGMTVARKNGGTQFVKSNVVSANQVLSDENIIRLGLLILRVFEALDYNMEQHQDIEWVFDGENFFLVQARPVTALPRYTCDGLKNQPDIWSNANFRDGAPMVMSTLGRYCLGIGFSDYLFSCSLRLVGYELPEGLVFVRLFQGRSYLNLSVEQWLTYDAFGFTPGEVNEMMGGHQPEIIINENKPYTGIQGLKRIIRVLKYIITATKIKNNAKKSFQMVDSFIQPLLMKDLSSMKDKNLIREFVGIRKMLIEYAPVMISLTTSPYLPSKMITQALEKSFPNQGRSLLNALMAGGGDITSAQHGYRLWEMAEIARGDVPARRFFSAEPFHPLRWEKELPEESPFKNSFRNFLAEYGHRGIYELDVINPRWREDPSYLLNMIRGTIDTADISKLKTRQKEKAAGAWREVKRRFPFYRRTLIKYWLKQALKCSELREMSKSVLVKFIEPQRMVFQELGRRFVARGILKEQGDIYHCTWTELASILRGDWDGRKLDVLVAERKAKREEMEALPPPDFIIDDVPKYVESVTTCTGNVLAGMGVAAGRASGSARLIYHPNEGEKLQAGDVLIAPSTDPGWTPLFLRASAIVMETGGLISYGAIVAREYGIPAVVNISGVMKMIKDSQLITVDGDEGKVFL